MTRTSTWTVGRSPSPGRSGIVCGLNRKRGALALPPGLSSASGRTWPNRGRGGGRGAVTDSSGIAGSGEIEQAARFADSKAVARVVERRRSMRASLHHPRERRHVRLHSGPSA